MKTRFLALAIAALFAGPALAAPAGTGSLTIGGVQTDMELLGEGTINGLNLKYQFEPAGSRVGFIGSFTYASGSDRVEQAGSRPVDLDLRYYSLALGPSYRIAPAVSLYGVVGFAGSKAETNTASVSDNFEPVVGAGVRVFPFADLVLGFGEQWNQKPT